MISSLDDCWKVLDSSKISKTIILEATVMFSWEFDELGITLDSMVFCLDGSVVLLKFSLKLSIPPPNPSMVKEVIWYPHLHSWIKVNCYRASKNNLVGDGGIFCNSSGVQLGSFSCFLGNSDSFFAEIMGAIISIEHAITFRWQCFLA
ncbi:unnamed protein product [Vicia faba]|uniref:RNase H type-1 domain-containing protein n=1 Tax=Vicia faba TaxID=3906 RepID=A0AAV0Z585_VICFA|nr:unnamed protein product [Vicia faba]